MSSYLYDTVEPDIISEEMLVQAVVEQGPVDEAARVAEQEGYDFKDVTSLRLDFKNINRIDGLWEFVNLTKLQLDNNIIERIENIEMLVNLVCLDLSFNNIEMIEGLTKLEKLEDLSLFNNSISRIENMDDLVNLQIFSIGNNNLKELENLNYLRRFKHLKSLNLSNNPVCELKEYKMYVAGFLPGLDFLDYRLLDEQTKERGYEKYNMSIELLNHEDMLGDNAREEAAREQENFEFHKKAFVENLDGQQLFDALFTNNPEGKLLIQVPDIADVLTIFKKKFTDICKKTFDFGIEEHKKREEDIKHFWECVNEAKNENKELGKKELKEFKLEKDAVFAELSVQMEPRTVEKLVRKFNKRLTELWDKLMDLEMTLLEQLEDTNKEFEHQMQDEVDTFLEKFRGYISQLREAEHVHMERLVDIANLTYERLNRLGSDEADTIVLPKAVSRLFDQKDALMNALSSTHDAHQLAIDSREDRTISRIKIWFKDMVATIHKDEEITRNRARVIEIARYVDRCREEMEGLELKGSNSGKDDDDDDGDDEFDEYEP